MTEHHLRQLGDIHPDSAFIKRARKRLLFRMQEHSAGWFVRLLRNMNKAMPSSIFVAMARRRLLARIAYAPRPAARYFFGWLQKIMASTAVMALIVVSTLFFVDGGQYVSAHAGNLLSVQSGEVLVQRAGAQEWEVAADSFVVKEGDTVQLNPAAQATVLFFDDSRLSLSDRATLVVNRMDPLARHGTGLIEVSLLAGRAWLQTVTIPNDYNGFTVRTPDALVGADQASADLIVNPKGATTVRVFRHHAMVGLLHEPTGSVMAQTKLPFDKELRADASDAVGPVSALAGLRSFSPDVYDDPWVRANVAEDTVHLLALQERERTLREKSAGVLPGHFLYPLKQVRERLASTLALTEKGRDRVQLTIANKRLTEAIVLLNQKRYAKAQEALMAYQSTVRQLAGRVGQNETLKARIEAELIARNSKSLVASLPTAQTHLVREAIGVTEELITADPLERETVRLQNAVETLTQLPDYLMAGDLAAAEEVMVSYQTMESRILSEAGAIADSGARKAVLNDILSLRSEGLLALKTFREQLNASDDAGDSRLPEMAASLDEMTRREINKVTAMITPLLPPEALERIDPLDKKTDRFVEKVEIYTAWTGQRNQISLLLKRAGRDAKNIEFLAKIRSRLTSPRARDFINREILELKRTARYNKHKSVERKIEQAKRMRE